MNSISAACYVIGNITLSLESGYIKYKGDWENREQVERRLSAFVHALEILSDILEDLKTWPHKAMNPLPPGLESAALACESDLNCLGQRLQELRRSVQREDVEKILATLQSNINSLWPYATSLSRYIARCSLQLVMLS